MDIKPQPSVMEHNFSRVPRAEIPRSTFKRDHGHKTTFDSGELIPIFVDEVLPGDTFDVKAAGFGRLATPIHPIMDNAFLDTFFFFVPNRLVWDNWEKFNGAQDNPNDSTDYLIPTIQCPSGGFSEGSLFDYFGIPTKVDLDQNDITNRPSALPFRAYNLIYNEWFRDQNLQDELNVYKGDAATGAGSFTVKKRGKRHDYFTSCLPWPQKGDAVNTPLLGQAPIKYNDTFGNNPTIADDYVVASTTSSGISQFANSTNIGQNDGRNSDDTDFNLYADLTEVTSATINDLRESFQIQKLLERDARSGTRYTEILQSHFGVTSPDFRLQRPEYLGGGSQPINVNPVAQTSSTDTTTPQGNLAAVSTVGFNGHGFNKSFTEHGIVIGLASVRADLTYQKGLDRMWSRQSRYDFYWPALAHLGEQAVLNKEIYAQGNSDDDDVFGYQERYAEYRYKNSLITGKFRSNADQSLDVWHLSQDFQNLPVLDGDFIEENPPFERINAVVNQPEIIMDFYFKFNATRPMPTYGVPGLIDHF